MSEKKWSDSSMHLGEGAEPGGVLQTWIDGNLDTVHAGFSACIDVLDQIRVQLNERVGQTLDWAEGFPHGAFTLARHVNRGIDMFAAHAIRATDRLGRSVLTGVRSAGHGARNFASDTSSTIIGHRAPHSEISTPRVAS
jgi:hypothetical protein